MWEIHCLKCLDTLDLRWSVPKGSELFTISCFPSHQVSFIVYLTLQAQGFLLPEIYCKHRYFSNVALIVTGRKKLLNLLLYFPIALYVIYKLERNHYTFQALLLEVLLIGGDAIVWQRWDFYVYNNFRTIEWNLTWRWRRLLVRFISPSSSADTDSLVNLQSLSLTCRNAARYDFTHEILHNSRSLFKGKPITKGRRISVICRNNPSSIPEDSWELQTRISFSTSSQCLQNLCHKHGLVYL